MNVEAFHGHYLDQRATIVQQEGILLAKKEWLSYYSWLFYVRGFFVEVWYEKQSNDILLVRGFTDVKSLRSYLRLIDLKDILPLLD